MKKFVVMIIAVTFIFCLSGLSFADTITKIEGNKITVMDDTGKTKTIESNAKGLKVGDKVRIKMKNGINWLDPQPEPPMDLKAKAKGINKAPSTPEAPPPPPKTSPQLQ